MQPSPQARSAAVRMFLALAVFGAALAGGVYWAVGYHGQANEKVRNSTRRATAKAGRPDAGSGGFFYDAIGRTPDQTRGSSSEQPGLPTANYTLELRVASTQQEAEQAVQSLQERGIEAYYTPLTRTGRVVYRVRRGIYSNEQEASRAAIALRDDHAVPADVVKLQ